MPLEAVFNDVVVAFAPSAFLYSTGRKIMCLLETLDQLPELHLLDLVRDPPEFEPVHVQRFLYEEKFGCSLGYHIRLKGGIFGVAEHSCDVFEFVISH